MSSSDRPTTGSSRAELSSVATSLDELVGRLGAVAVGLGGAERDALAGDLYEIERQLVTARRRLGRLLDSPNG